MKELSDRDKDIISTQARMMEQEMWQAAQAKEETYKPKLTMSRLMDKYPRVVMLSAAPLLTIVLAIVADLLD